MRVFPLLLACLALTACNEQAPKEAAIPEVFVITATEQPYRPSQGFSARIESRSDVAISAQVSGRLMAIHFKEGDQIKKGAPLFDIDPAPYKAALARAEAEHSKAEANVKISAKNFERGKKLVVDGFISESEFDSLEAKKLEATAQEESTIASVQSAKVDLEYTKIKAPLDGRIGRSAPAVGDVISPQSGTLTSLVGQNDMDLVFQIPERLLLSVQKKDSNITLKDIVVALQFQNGNEYPQTGQVDYFSNRVDTTTGTVEVRSRIANPNDRLRPGMFARAVLRLAKPLDSLMIPQATVQVDQRGTYALAVDENNMVTRKNIITGERVGENVLVNSGLEPGASIIIRGIQQARPGDTVQATPFKPATTATEE